MATTDTTPPTDRLDITIGDITSFLRDYYRDELGAFVESYPSETTTFTISWRDLNRAYPELASDYLQHPEIVEPYLDDGLSNVELPVAVDLDAASVVVTDLPEEYTYYPGGFSPTDEAGGYRAITGEISKATDVYSKLVTAAFRCLRCDLPDVITVPQTGTEFQEPVECPHCERDGPYDIVLEKSDQIDAQTLRVQTPPEMANGTGQHLDVYVEGDMAAAADVGDRVTITGTVHLEQVGSKNSKTAKLEPYLKGHHISVEASDHQDLDITPEEKERIKQLAAGEDGDPLDLAADSLAPKIEGHKQIKRMSVLAMVGGARTVYGPDDADRGEFHMLLLGDPGTGKSKLVEQVEQLGFRTVGVSGKGATKAGITATAEQDDFGEGETWTLSAGAFVKANGGVVCVDELDDMPKDVRAAMLEPMSKQAINVSKAGINTKLRAQTAVVAAGNPKNGRFDPFADKQEQFDFDAALLSRFDLIYTLQDRPDQERDREVATQITTARDAAKRQMRGLALSEEQSAAISRPVDPEILRKWVAVAKQQPAPVWSDEGVRESLVDGFQTLRGVNGYEEDAAVPVTFRKLEGIIRIAEAAAKFELSEEITERHAQIAREAVGRSMQDYGTDDAGRLDADVQETGQSKSQRDRVKTVVSVMQQVAEEGDGRNALRSRVVEEAVERLGTTESKVEHVIAELKKEGACYEPEQGKIKWLGRSS